MVLEYSLTRLSMAKYDQFKQHNTRKLNALQDTLTTQRWKVFAAIPALLHFNFSTLPGYGDGHAPHGFVHPYFPPDTENVSKEFFPELRGDMPPPRQSAFLGLYAMGSVGSVFFTSASDIDFWLIHPANGLDAFDRTTLEAKLRIIEKWAWEKANLETHFYIHDLGEIQRATFSYDTENANEFGPILKEEFLRTMVHVAGAEPSFWGGTGDATTIDFGAIPRLSSKQYLAACLMLLEKAIEKPFKAALKIALLRRLARRPGEKLPAEISLERIENGESPDAYILLLEYLWEHFQSVKNPEAHAFIKSVLYLKMVAEESAPERLRRNKERLIASRFQAIGSPVDLDSFDTFFSWPFERRIRFSDQTALFLQDSIREISRYPEATALNAGKLRSLTQKIIVRRKTGADVIESLTFADVPSRGESVLSFVRDESRGEWLLSLARFVGRPDVDKLAPIKTAPHVIPLIAFAVKNNLLKNNRTEIRAFPSDLFPRKAAEVVEAIERLLDLTSPLEALDRPARPDRHLVIIEQPISNRIETRQVTVLTRTTWDVMEWKVFAGAEALVQALNHILRQEPAVKGAEFLSDVSAGPDLAQLRGVLVRAFTAGPAAGWLITDQSRYILIRNRKASGADTPEEILLALGRQGGSFTFDDLPADPGGQLLKRLAKDPPAGRIRIYKFALPATTGFLLVDQVGRCHAWRMSEENARYDLKTQIDYIRLQAPGVPIETYSLSFRKSLPDPWHVSSFLPENKRHANPGADIRIELLEGSMVSVQIGARRIEQQSLSQAVTLIARFIDALRQSGREYPSYCTTLAFHEGVAGRISPADALKMKHQIEEKIDAQRAPRKK